MQHLPPRTAAKLTGTRVFILSAIVTVGMVVSGFATKARATTSTESNPLTQRVLLEPDMLRGETAFAGNVATLVDEQALVGDPPTGKPASGWDFDYRHQQSLPHSVVIDLGRDRTLAKFWFFDTFNVGRLRLEVGEPGAWQEVAVVSTERFQSWVAIPLDRTCRYLRLSRLDAATNIAEIAIDEYTPWGLTDLEARRQAAREREAALRAAEEETRRRPIVDLGSPFGKLPLVDEIDCAAEPPEYGFREDPPGVSEVREILGHPCRILRPLPDQSAYVAYRLGR